MDGLNQAADIVTKNLTKSLIDLRGFGLAAQVIPELRLNHAERGFDVRTLVIVLHKLLCVVAVEMKHPFPNRAAELLRTRRVALKGNVRRSRFREHHLEILSRRIGFVCGDFIHHETLCCSFDQRKELRAVSGMAFRYLNSCDDICFDAAHDVAFDELSLLDQVRLCVLRSHPLNEAGSRKTGRVNGKVSFDGLQRETALLNEAFENRRQSGIFKVAGNRIVVRRFRQVALGLGVSQVAHKAPTGHRRVDLERACENHISERQARASERLCGCFDAFAQVCEQLKEAFLLVSLRTVIRSPFLLIAFLYCDRLSDGLGLTIISVFTLNGERNGEQMFACELSLFEVWAGAMLSYGVNGVLTFTSLRWNDPEITITGESGLSGYFKAFLFSGFHGVFSFLEKTQPEAYNLGCLGHIASAVWLNVPVGVCAPIGTAILAAGIRFERMGVSKHPGGFKDRCNWPLCQPAANNSQRTSRFLLLTTSFDFLDQFVFVSHPSSYPFLKVIAVYPTIASVSFAIRRNDNLVTIYQASNNRMNGRQGILMPSNGGTKLEDSVPYFDWRQHLVRSRQDLSNGVCYSYSGASCNTRLQVGVFFLYLLKVKIGEFSQTYRCQPNFVHSVFKRFFLFYERFIFGAQNSQLSNSRFERFLVVVTCHGSILRYV